MPYLKLESSLSNIGKPIIQIKGGTKDKHILYLVDDYNESSESESEEKNESEDTDNENILLEEIINDIVNKNATNNRMRERNRDIEAITRGFKNKKVSFRDDRIDKLYKMSKKKFEDVKKSEFKIKDGKLRLLPSLDKDQRNSLYIAGPSGSGKSTLVKEYAEKYNQMFPDNDVYLFSKIIGDKSLKGIKNLKQIELNEQIVDDPIHLNEFKNTLVIMDDIGKIRDKEVKKEIDFLLSEILEEGRHPNIECVATNHIIADHKNTKSLLNECSFISVFPHCNKLQIRYLLKQYIGLDNSQLKDLFNKVKGSRWMTIHTRAPNYVIYEHGCFLL